MTPRERARRLLQESDHIVVATSAADSTPWISPVFYVADENFDLYWTSDRQARHSENIRSTGRAAIVIFEVEPSRPVDAVYMQAAVDELHIPDEVRHGIEVMARRRQPQKWLIESSGDVIGDGPWRIYRARLDSIEVRADGARAGKAVALRQPADFRPGS